MLLFINVTVPKMTIPLATKTNPPTSGVLSLRQLQYKRIRFWHQKILKGQKKQITAKIPKPGTFPSFHPLGPRPENGTPSAPLRPPAPLRRFAIAPWGRDFEKNDKKKGCSKDRELRKVDATLPVNSPICRGDLRTVGFKVCLEV